MGLNTQRVLLGFAGLLIGLSLAVGPNAAAERPNILLIYADDLGYGDLRCYNRQGKAATANIDRLAAQGLRFTDAHSPATVCTPSRYGLLTGRFPFRIGAASRVFVGLDGPCLIKPNDLTLPGMLQQCGYRTALTGKWHVGLTFFDRETGQPIHRGGVENVRRADFTRRIPDAPIHRGFDEFFGTACCPTTDHLYAYIDGDRVAEPPTILLDEAEKRRRELPFNAYTRDFRVGLASKTFEPENVDLRFLEASQAFLRRQRRDHPEQPFFLMHSTQAVHLPSIPAPRYRGQTEAGPHGDFIHEFDDIVGRLLGTLKQLGYAENTLVILSSDNGPELPTARDMRKTYQHDGARPWRGLKRDSWEGGHRTPLIVRWPGHVKPGVSAELVNQTDLLATIAEIVDFKLPNEAAEDSVSILGVWRGETGLTRTYAVQQALRGRSIRKGRWKYLDHRGSGGNHYDRDGEWGAKPFALREQAPDAPGQLYDLQTDPGETTNLYFKRPELVAELKAKLDQFVEQSRSAPRRTSE